MDAKQKAIESECEALKELLIVKNQLYGNAVFESPCMADFMAPFTALLVRMSDKVGRIKSLLLNGGGQIVGESMDDALRDLAGYCVLALVARREEPEERK